MDCRAIRMAPSLFFVIGLAAAALVVVMPGVRAARGAVDGQQGKRQDNSSESRVGTDCLL